MNTISEEIKNNIEKKLESIIGNEYKVQEWTNIVIEKDTLVGTFRCKNDPKHYIISMTKGDDNYTIGELN